MTETYLVRTVRAEEAAHLIPELCRVLIGCVASGASLSFFHPLSLEKAELFWRRVFERLAAAELILLVAETQNGRVVGTVQVQTDMPENQPHRGGIAKLLVAPEVRRKGLATRLMAWAEAAARAAGRTLLVLDTAGEGEAMRLYQRLGWTEAGRIPGYALLPDGTSRSTVIFWKALAPRPGAL